jgi:hypothetical protein
LAMSFVVSALLLEVRRLQMSLERVGILVISNSRTRFGGEAMMPPTLTREEAMLEDAG